MGIYSCALASMPSINLAEAGMLRRGGCVDRGHWCGLESAKHAARCSAVMCPVASALANARSIPLHAIQGLGEYIYIISIRS